MTEEERAALTAQLETLRRKLEARRGRPGLAANVAELEERIAEIEGLLAPVVVEPELPAEPEPEPEPEPPADEPPADLEPDPQDEAPPEVPEPVAPEPPPVEETEPGDE